ncbi:uncharacterized protein LOC125653421 [Ostrea edulis]|uniref:uncharacterized protein LOC125653421 n=1 Tax=Ostrea edulis TaxID=37623 RepID=UPI0024AECE15|nr:uncharacterized protein LOC125653421 [Ostrea edulis]
MPRKLDFENVPSLDDVLKTNSLFLELVLNSRLLCGAECSVHVDVCRSYAWNRLSLRCLIYSLKFDSAPVSASTELGWQHYNVKVCPTTIPNGAINLSGVFTPGTTSNATCDFGYGTISGQITAACNAHYQTEVSDTCHPLIMDAALGRPSKESTTIMSSNPASVAVDGNRDTNWMSGSCTHTSFGDPTPWWRVDLQRVLYIITVRLLNRGSDSTGIDSSGRLKDATVNTGNTTLSITTPCGFFAGPGTLGQLVTINCPPYTVGRFVKISIVTEFLTLCEVDVFAIAP